MDDTNNILHLDVHQNRKSQISLARALKILGTCEALATMNVMVVQDSKLDGDQERAAFSRTVHSFVHTKLMNALDLYTLTDDEREQINAIAKEAMDSAIKSVNLMLAKSN